MKSCNFSTYKILYIFLILALLPFLQQCKAPTIKQITKDGGVWKITSLQYTEQDGFDTTFIDCGTVEVSEEPDEYKEEDNWNIQGSITEPTKTFVNGQQQFVWATYYFFGSTRDHVLQISDKMTIFNFQAETIEVTKRQGNQMEWKHTNWDGDKTWYYKLSRE